MPDISQFRTDNRNSGGIVVEEIDGDGRAIPLPTYVREGRGDEANNQNMVDGGRMINRGRSLANSSGISAQIFDENGNTYAPPEPPARHSGPSAEIVAARRANAERQGVTIDPTKRGQRINSSRTELDPTSLGIVEQYHEKPKDYKDKALDRFDSQITKRFEEDIKLREDLALKLGRVPTEDEVLEAKGMDYIPKYMKDPTRASALKYNGATDEEVHERFVKKEADYARIEAEEERQRELAEEEARFDAMEKGETYEQPDEEVDTEEINYDAMVADLNLPENPWEILAQPAPAANEKSDAIQVNTHELNIGFDMEEEAMANDETKEAVTEVQEEVPVDEVVNDEVLDTTMSENFVEDTFEEFKDEDDEDEEAKPEKTVKISDERRKMVEKRYKDQIRSKLMPAIKKYDFSTFSVAGTTTLTKSKPTRTQQVLTWPLINAGRPIKVSSMTASELDTLFKGSKNVTQYMSVKARYELLYKHVLSAKPETVEGWLKTIPFKDKEHLWFAWFAANFSGSNYLPRTCQEEECQNQFLTEDIPIKKMVKFTDNRAIAMFNDAITMDPNDVAAFSSIWTSEVIPVSTNYAIGFREPSMFDVILEPNLVSEDNDYYTKHEDAIVKGIFIDKVYQIDYENMRFVEITFPVFAGKQTKSYKARVNTIEQVLATMNSAEMDLVNLCISLIEGTINIKKLGDLIDTTSEEYQERLVMESISYVQPEYECPECKATIPERPIGNTEMLLFQRHQLASRAM